MSNRCVVTVIKSYGDLPRSEAIINGVVSAEMKRIKDERDFAEWRLQNRRKQQRVESTFSYDVKPSTGLIRFMEQLVGMAILIREERRCSNENY